MYDSTTIPNPFRPGTGAYPPVLAGREAEQSTLTEELLRISHASLAGPANPLLLSAPRGMGKTVLLSWLARQAETQDVQVVAAAAGDMPDLVGLAGILWPDSRKTPSRLTSIKQALVGGGLAATGARSFFEPAAGGATGTSAPRHCGSPDTDPNR